MRVQLNGTFMRQMFWTMQSYNILVLYGLMYGRRSQLAEFADLSNMVFPCCLCVIDVKLVSSFFFLWSISWGEVRSWCKGRVEDCRFWTFDPVGFCLNSLQGKAQDDGAANGGGTAETKVTCNSFSGWCIMEKLHVLIRVVEIKAF